MKTPTAKDLKTYFPGWNCECMASSAGDCGCAGADWTPHEVYRLRLVVKRLRNKIKKLKGLK